MKKITTIIIVVLVILGIGLIWIASASSAQHCSETMSIVQLHGLCLAGRLSVLVFFLALEVAFGIGGGLQAKARNHPFIKGFLLGFFLSFLGALFAMMLSPRIPKKKK